MKKKILIYILMITSITGFSQISGVFCYNGMGKNRFGYSINCNIYLYKTGKYEIFLEEKESSDFISVMDFSYGTYTIVGDKIILKDKYYGFTMSFYYLEESLIAKKAFHLLLNKVFKKSSFELFDGPSKNDMQITALRQTREKFKAEVQKNQELKTGVYSNTTGISINIQKDIYQINYCGIILSKGKWVKKENELLFSDEDVNCSFQALSNESCLYIFFILFDFGCLPPR